MWGNWANFKFFAYSKFTSILVFGHYPVGWLVRSRGLPANMEAIGWVTPPYWLSGSQWVGMHLRLGWLLASHSSQVLMSPRPWERWFLALSSYGCLGFWAISNPSPWEESHEFALFFCYISFVLMATSISFFCLQPRYLILENIFAYIS